MLTLNKLAYRIIVCGQSFLPTDAVVPMTVDAQHMNLEDQLPLASAILMARPLPAGVVPLIDEGQDVTGKFVDFCDALRGPARKRQVWGDPKQEVYSGAVWFSSLWTSADEKKRAVLSYNWRSLPVIVDMLNKYTECAFPTLHIPQKAGRDAKMDEAEEGKKSEGNGVVPGVFVLSVHPTEMADAITAELIKTSPEDVSAPVSCRT